ncbi:small membrane protein [Klebsiella oxytoca]|nr:small membrane protein [Klebsiella oxytoca]
MSGIAVLIVALILLIAAIYNLFSYVRERRQSSLPSKKKNVSLLIICQKINNAVRI